MNLQPKSIWQRKTSKIPVWLFTNTEELIVMLLAPMHLPENNVTLTYATSCALFVIMPVASVTVCLTQISAKICVDMHSILQQRWCNTEPPTTDQKESCNRHACACIWDSVTKHIKIIPKLVTAVTCFSSTCILSRGVLYRAAELAWMKCTWVCWFVWGWRSGVVFLLSLFIRPLAVLFHIIAAISCTSKLFSVLSPNKKQEQRSGAWA